MADGNEAALQGDVFGVAVLRALDAHAGDTAGFAQYLLQGEVGFEDDFSFLHFGHQLIDQDGFGGKFVTAVNEGDRAGDVGQVQGFFHRRVAAADHADGLVTVEKAIAGGTAGNAPAHEFCF